MSILKINGIELPDPTDYKVDVEPVGHFERNANGYLVGDLIGVKTKISCAWAMLSDVYFEEILAAAAPYFVNVTYLDPQINGLVTKEMILSPQSASLAVCRAEEKWWANVSVAFTER